MTKCIFSFFVVLTIACSRYPSQVERALKLAGNNSDELVRVLEHYRKRPEDSLKYRAACFLVENMPLHFYYQSAKIDTFKTANRLAKINQIGLGDAISELEKRYGSLSQDNAKKVYDIQVVSSDFLITNIELAFQVWNEMPYGKYYGFDEFCEYVLPYRVNGEQLENWRELFYHTFKTITDTLSCRNDPVYAAKVINDYLMTKNFNFFFNENVPSMGPVTLWKDPFGTCLEMTSLTVYALRSVGIPCGIDMMVQRPNMEGKHFWNFVLDTTRRTVSFAGLEKAPVRGIAPDYKLGKVFRVFYSLQNESFSFIAPKGAIIPFSLANPFIKDVSSEYMDNNTITIDTRIVDKLQKKKQYYFLSVFDNHRWVPIDWVILNGNKATFNNVENNIAYIVLTYDGMKQVHVSHPFILTDNKAELLIPDNAHLSDIRIDRKYYMKDVAYTRMNGMIGGLFHGANREDFNDANLLWRIADYPRFCFQYVDFPLSKSEYRYLRYIAPEGTKANVSEIEAFDRNGNRIEGKRVFGTKGNNWSALEYIYDGNPLSYYESEGDISPVWVAVDFGKPYEIGSLRYICRNDDNSIRDGDQYELFYCDDTGWHSLGDRIGDRNHALVFHNAPTNALFWLRNYTRGKEERIFTYVDGKQEWW